MASEPEGRSMNESLQAELRRAAAALDAADALVVSAGAGMGVDSGLPDFRGVEGFWEAYPPYAHLGLNFYELANPRWFRHDPPLAWGFYGHRLNLYRAARPHEGFAVLKRWGASTPRGAWVVTSNVDGQFQRAGFDADHVVEIHGAIDWMQCHAGCGAVAFPADPYEVVVDESTMRAAPPFPTCPACGGLARPNILMFGDFDWDNARSDAQEQAFARWSTSLPPDGEGLSLVVVECGAGKAVPSIRNASESLARRFHGTLIRINPREPDVPRGHIGLALNSLAALKAIDELRAT
jgi:NAD-dependent SIR2 family protein deacetylase